MINDVCFQFIFCRSGAVSVISTNHWSCLFTMHLPITAAVCLPSPITTAVNLPLIHYCSCLFSIHPLLQLFIFHSPITVAVYFPLIHYCSCLSSTHPLLHLFIDHSLITAAVYCSLTHYCSCLFTTHHRLLYKWSSSRVHEKSASITTDPNTVQNKIKLLIMMRIKLTSNFNATTHIFWEILPSIFACFYIW